MFTKLEESSGDVIGFQVSGVIKRKDYEILNSEVETLLNEYEKMNCLLYFKDFIWEVLGAWGKDSAFGLKYGSRINKLAIVGDKKWQEKIAKWAIPFYGENGKFFKTEDIDAAWEWLREK